MALEQRPWCHDVRQPVCAPGKRCGGQTASGDRGRRVRHSPGERGRPRQPAVARIAAEELVGTLATDGHGDRPAGEARQRLEGHQRRVRERLVEGAEHPRHPLRDLGLRHHKLVVIGAELLGGAA